MPYTLKDKLVITGEITLVTGMHIGASNDFSPIGAVDSVVVRDPLTRQPIIPGSSLKGKMRTLLARTESDSPVLARIENDSLPLCRLFGSSDNKDKSKSMLPARLQFYDLFIMDESKKAFEDKTDLYLTEIKFENTINRTTSVANPRQIERVPAGMKFKLNLVYNLESLEEGSNEVAEDFENIARAFKLLQMDYIGGNGTRGYGRLKFIGLKVEAKNILREETPFDTSEIEDILKGAENFALLSV